MLRVRILFFCFLSLFLSAVSGLAQTGQDYAYLSPKPNAQFVPPEAAVIVRFARFSPKRLLNQHQFVSISGKESGEHTGITRLASDGKTIIFTPDSPFIPDELVLVTLKPDFEGASGSGFNPITYQFRIAEWSRPDVFTPAPNPKPAEGTDFAGSLRTAQARIMPNGVSVPSDFPHVEVTYSDNPSPGFIFMDNRGGRGRPYNIIFDNAGSPVWWLRTNDERRDFKAQPNGWMTMMIRDGFGGSGWGFIALDNHYEVVKTFRASNGYTSDEHELRVLEDGGWWIVGRRDVPNFDLSGIVPGGKKNATVRETCIQQYTADDELIFQWAALDYFEITDYLDDLTQSYIRFPHINSIDFDDDGNIIISSRYISEITKIDRETGDIIWRFCGKNNEFDFINDPLEGVSGQHAARVHGNGVYSMFDNGTLRQSNVSRAVKYRLDTDQMTAALIWEFRESPDVYSHYMGNAQPLPDGNMLINWAVGNLPKVTEVRPDGSKTLELNYVDEYECYRVHKCVWEGKARVPVLEAEPQNDKVTLIFNQFGDPDAAYYNIYAGQNRNPTTLIDTSRSTLKHIDNLDTGTYWFRVTSVNGNGQESGYSNQVQSAVFVTEPGSNLIQNGNFSEDQDGWTWEVRGSGQADWSVQNGEAQIVITNGGGEDHEVQLRQNGLPLIQGKSYIFEFETKADQPRTIEAKIGQDNDPWINYSRIGLTYITRQMKHFEYEFEMQDPSDFNARVVFNMGISDFDMVLDNISLTQKGDQGSYSDSPIDQFSLKYRLYPNSPNPFNPATEIRYTLAQDGPVSLAVYAVNGRLVRHLVQNRQQAAGNYSQHWNGRDEAERPVSSGTYILNLRAGQFRKSRKILLIR